MRRGAWQGHRVVTPGDPSLIAALAVLAGGLDDAAVDLDDRFARFAAAVHGAVPSFCGLSITVMIDGIPVTDRGPLG